MGLLDRARDAQTRDYPVPAAAEASPAESDFNRVINELTALEPGLDYGAVLFRQTVENLAIDKGALFLQSGDGHDYYCLCNRGYDKTTSSRLRLEKDFFSNPSVQKGFEKSQPFTVKAPCPFLKDYFSNREYGLIEEIHIIPFNHNNSLFSLMLVTEWSELIPLGWEDLMRSLSLKTSEILFNSRLALISPSDSEYAGTAEIRRIISEILEEKPEQEMLFIRLSLDNLLNELTGSAGGLSAVNIKQEILSVFKTMSGGSAGIPRASHGALRAGGA